MVKRRHQTAYPIETHGEQIARKPGRLTSQEMDRLLEAFPEGYSWNGLKQELGYLHRQRDCENPDQDDVEELILEVIHRLPRHWFDREAISQARWLRANDAFYHLDDPPHLPPDPVLPPKPKKFEFFVKIFAYIVSFTVFARKIKT